MGSFFVDESIHENGDFIIAACLYSETDLQDEIIQVFNLFGQDPDEFEFKSSTSYCKNPDLIALRSAMKKILVSKCKLGLVVLPLTARENIAIECLNAVQQFVKVNDIGLPGEVYLDQGMIKINNRLANLIDQLKADNLFVWPEQDSKKIKGIQLADLAAHIAAIQLKGQMGLIKKNVKIEGDSIYDEVELTFEMYSALRYVFFKETDKPYDREEDRIKAATLMVEPYGLYISKYCDEELAQTARNLFSAVYVGCIH
jgi:hypothetical protein